MTTTTNGEVEAKSEPTTAKGEVEARSEPTTVNGEIEAKLEPTSNQDDSVEYIVGLDFGTDNAVLTLTSVKTVKPEILRNDVSTQSTPICVVFNERDRAFGTVGLQLETTRKENTVRGILRAIGKSKEEFGSLAPWCACQTTPNESGGVDFKISFQGKEMSLPPEQIMATILAKLVQFAEKEIDQDQKFKVSITVPDSFGPEELSAIKTAAAISGVEIVRAVRRSAANCITYGTRKREEQLNDSTTLLIDVGHGYVSSSAYKWENKKAKHLVTKSAEDLGSYRIDQVIFEELNKDFKEKYGQEVLPGSKGAIRLLKVCQKLKESLSAVPEADATCENLFDGQDIKISFTRDRLENACSELKTQIQKLITDTLDECEETITTCELVGGGVRVPFVKDAISEALNNSVPLSYTLDSMASPATGASFAGVRLFEPIGVRRPAFDNLAMIDNDEGIFDLTELPHSLDAIELEKHKQLEESMQKADGEFAALSAARNKLEAFVFETRSAARGERKHGELIDREACEKVLGEFEDWMYSDEVCHAKKEDFEKKLLDLENQLQPSCSAYFQKVEQTKLEKEKELEEISKKAAEEVEASGGKDDHDFRKLKKPERMKKVMINKNEGTSLFKDGNYEAASLRYKRALQHCDKFFDLSEEDKTEVEDLKHTLHLNMTMCYIKLEDWDKGLSSINKSLEIKDESGKALYRRALILEKKKEFEKAKKDLLKASKVEPNEKSIVRLLERVNVQIKREKLKQKKMAQKMFA